MLNWLRRRIPGSRPGAFASLMETGLAHHRAGRFEQACAHYLQAVDLDGGDAHALHLYALALAGCGRREEALAKLESAIGIDGGSARYRTAAAECLRAMNRNDEALGQARAAVDRDPGSGAAHNELGLCLVAAGRVDEAMALFEAATRLAPDWSEGWGNAGNALLSLGRADEALVRYREALRLGLSDRGIRLNAVAALRAVGRIDEALDRCQEILAEDPRFVRASVLAAELLERKGDTANARALFDSAVDFVPDDAQLWTDYGYFLQRMEALDDAATAYRRALAIAPEHPGALNNLGMVLFEDNRVDEAESLLERAVERPDARPEAWSNLGNLRAAQGRVDEALASFDHAARAGLDTADARFDRSLALLLAGRFAAGFAEYEERFRTTPWADVRQDWPAPRWRGEALAGRTLLLWAEQGLGDTLQFVRYAPALAQRGARIVLLVQPALRRLLTASMDATVLVPGDPLPAIDFHCPLMSLPHAFGTTLETVPSAASYLRVPTEAAAAMAGVFTGTSAPRIGLVWAGNPTHRNDRNRSLPFAALRPLLEATRATFVPLQMPGTVPEPEVPAHTHWLSVMHRVHDFADTAALLEQLDLLITVDTSVAHLAGGLGRPAWVLLPFAPDWRWMLDRPDTPWYPGLTLFRQRRAGEWAPVIEALTRELRVAVADKAALPC
ncbi:MAG: tetratricopeptide repeat protein [Betaproteobacteria bacterium]